MIAMSEWPSTGVDARLIEIVDPEFSAFAGRLIGLNAVHPVFGAFQQAPGEHV